MQTGKNAFASLLFIGTLLSCGASELYAQEIVPGKRQDSPPVYKSDKKENAKKGTEKVDKSSKENPPGKFGGEVFSFPDPCKINIKKCWE